MMVNSNICPIGNTLDVFNRKWIFCIIANIFNGMAHFNEFKQANPTISNHVLSQTLKYMETHDLVIKTIIDEAHNKTEYQLTEKGLKTNKILFEITSYYFDELDVDFDEESKKELVDDYKKIYSVI